MDELEEFVFVILDELETRMLNRFKELSMKATWLKEVVYELIEEM